MSARDEAIELAKQKTLVPLGGAAWPASVQVRRLTARQRLYYEDWCEEEDKPEVSEKDKRLGRLAKLVICTLATEDGSPLFTREDLETVKEFPGDMVGAAFEAACKLNGMRKEDVEAVEKNSESGPCAAS